MTAEFEIGDRVQIKFDIDYVKLKVNAIKVWNAGIGKYFATEGEYGTIVALNDDVAQVEIDGRGTWWYPIICLDLT